HGVGLDRNVTLGIHQLGAEGLEERAGGIDRVGRLPEADPEREAGLVAGFGGLQEGVDGPALGLRRGAGRIQCLDIDAGVLLHEIDARARSLDLAADRRRYREPGALTAAEIFDRAVD